ncbi:lipopolysaccharide biosynthesis protein [Mesorhizobium sp. B2-5-3]|uniref:lipopolysaccharide biosynthesis protein n=1 Tax=Mesorhizobium sp. B2-5-3 TaxID=2589927 RepID=UPI00112E630F|nr:lipopolysaccharide biosynthesis protein [Mesorhizobium sp. B2-5-3]TPK31719.1 lipopolysaccharide biosynthesis protein [Mesorhizobium sp. B2-5-3]
MAEDVTAVAKPSGWMRARRVARDVTFTTSASGVAALCSILALALNARSLGPGNFGTLAVIQAYVAFVSGLCTFESWQLVIRLCARSPLRLGPAASCGIALDVSAALLATVLAIGGILLFGEAVGVSRDNRLLAIIYSLTLLASLSGTPKGVLRLNGRYHVIAGNQLMQGVAVVVASLVLWILDASLPDYVIVLAAVGAFYNLTLFVRMLLYARQEHIELLNPLRSRSKRRFFWAFLAMATGTSLLSTLVSARRHLALFLVAGLLGEVAAGSYSLASRLATMVSRLTGPLNQVIFPEIAKLSRQEPPSRLYRLNARITVVSACAATGMAVVGVLLQNPIVLLAGGSAYAEASLLFAILFAAECFGLVGMHLNPLIQVLAGTKPLLKITALAIAVYVPLCLALSGWIGISGIAWAGLLVSAAVYAAMMVVSHLLLKRRIRLAEDI